MVNGTITKITNFGVFVGLEDGLEGLLHISELSDDKVENAEELVQVNRNLIRELDTGDELDQEIELAMGGSETADYDIGLAPSLSVNSVVEGKILRVDSEFVLVDVGYKSEGHIPRNEWDENERGG
ncbi:MAG: S1 RNA-binding domain-containing protein [Planctomycetia bacterium]|nr:S1 RNA-binding domain-containing protein [Planctomycetia bacterium]